MNDFKSFEIISGNRDKGMVILGDHAMRNLPERYGRLGLPETAFSRHIAYDIGIEGLCRKLFGAAWRALRTGRLFPVC